MTHCFSFLKWTIIILLFLSIIGWPLTTYFIVKKINQLLIKVAQVTPPPLSHTIGNEADWIKEVERCRLTLVIVSLLQASLDIFGLLALACCSITSSALCTILVYFILEAIAIIGWAIRVITWQVASMQTWIFTFPPRLEMRVDEYWAVLGVSMTIELLLLVYLYMLYHSNSGLGRNSSKPSRHNSRHGKR